MSAQQLLLNFLIDEAPSVEAFKIEDSKNITEEELDRMRRWVHETKAFTQYPQFYDLANDYAAERGWS